MALLLVVGGVWPCAYRSTAMRGRIVVAQSWRPHLVRRRVHVIAGLLLLLLLLILNLSALARVFLDSLLEDLANIHAFLSWTSSSGRSERVRHRRDIPLAIALVFISIDEVGADLGQASAILY